MTTADQATVLDTYANCLLRFIALHRGGRDSGHPGWTPAELRLLPTTVRTTVAGLTPGPSLSMTPETSQEGAEAPCSADSARRSSVPLINARSGLTKVNAPWTDTTAAWMAPSFQAFVPQTH